MRKRLAHEIIKLGGRDKPSEDTIIFFHGMLGRRTNLRSFARKFVNERFQALLVDHRGHGESGTGFPSPNTVQSCAEDTQALIADLVSDGSLVKPPNVVVGHSFGGKVSLKLREMSSDLKLTWVLDAAPGPINPKLFDSDNKRESVVRLKQEIKTLPHWKTKSELVKLLTERDFSPMVAQWMTTNVITRSDGTIGFVFDINVIDELFDDYCKLDMFPELTAKLPDKQVHFIRAGRNVNMWNSVVLEKFETIVDSETVHLHTMPKVGHFLHVEDPDGVCGIMNPILEQMD